jgi:hypothetical protein
VLVFPVWASSYRLMASPSLTSPSWSPLNVAANVTLTNLGNYIAAVMPLTNNAMFFRLQR